MGGRSLTWGRQSYQLSDFDFEANAKEGIAVDWPIRYQEMAPWYSYVEKFAGISGSKEGLPQLPDGEFMPPMDMNCVEKDVAARIKKHYAHRRMVIGRTANITRAHHNRVACQYQNKCWLGCQFGAYFSTQSTTLPAAVATGNLTLRPFSIVTKILYDKDTKRATGVEVLDAETNQTTEYFAKVIFLNASTLNSAWVLMNSATDVWPGGLGSSSGELGHNLMDHHFRAGAHGGAEGFDDQYAYGRRANGIYIPRYRNLFGDKRDYLRGFGSYQLHLEWRVPANITGTGQARGNSGVFLAALGKGDLGYELQILDSYNNKTNGMAGSIYKQHVPLANPTRKPGEWQTYDVVWTAPTFGAGGALATPARVTVLFNGVLVQHNVALLGPTLYIGKPGYQAHGPAPIELQSHGDKSEPLSFRNIWVRELPAGK